MSKKLIYSLMAVLIFLQYLAPLPAIAQELVKAENELTLSSLTVVGETESTIDVKLDGRASNSQEVPVNKQLTVGTAAKLVAQSSSTSGSIVAPALVTESGVQLAIPAQTQGDFSLTFSIDRQSVGADSSFVLNGEGQTVSTILPIQEDTSSSSSEAVQSSDTQDSSTVIESNSSSQESEASTEQSTQNSSSVPEKQVRAEDGTDIRTYFDSGNGTIISDAKVTYYDSDGNELTGSIPADANVNIHYTWSIPEEIRDKIQPNDYFTFQLPAEVVATPHSGELKNADGTVYGTYTVDENGKVTMLFNENVTDEFDINGSFDFDTKFNPNVITTPGDKTITFPAEDDLPPVDVFVKPSTDTSISKAGKMDKTPNPDSVTWTVDINQAMNELENPTVTETWPNGVTLDKDSIKVYKLVMNLDGTVNSVGETLTPDQYTVDANGNVTILGDTSDAYRVEYVTDIDDSTIPNGGGSVPLKNHADLSDDKDPTKIPAEATVTADYGKLLEKDSSGYDSANQQFSWTIKYNYGEKDIAKEDAVITDTMSENMELIQDSLVIYPITFTADGKEVQQAPLPASAYTIEPNPNGPGFVIKFADGIDGAYKITYKTQVNGVVTGTTPVDNKVTVDDGESSTGGGNATQQNIIKTMSSVDYTNSTATWRLVINRNHYTMNNLTVKDEFDPVPGMALARPDEGVSDGYELKITSSSGKVLELGKDYELVVNNYDGSSDYGFDIKFIGDYAQTTESFTIDYTTKLDISVIDPRDPTKDHFYNKGTASWTDENNDPHTSTDDKDFEPKPEFSYNAGKSGAYNAQSKTITWTIQTNLSQNQLHDATLTDPITGNQEYVPDSLKVYYGVTHADGTVTKESDTPINDQMVTIKQPNENNNTLFIQFPNNQKTYYIEFETSLTDKVVNEAKTYENTATYVNDGVSRDIVGEVSIKNGGSHVQKNGKQDPTDPNYVLWDVTINPSLSTLSDVVVTDKPSNNQIVDQDSVKLYGTTIAADGTVTVDHSKVLTEGVDYTVAVTTDNVTGDQELKVTFLNEINTAYVMEYRALISSSASGSTDKVSNQVSITGTGSEEVDDNGNSDVTVEIDHSSGSASGTKGKITLEKTTEEHVIMPGVHFELWNLDKTQLLREGDVDASGHITFGNLKLGQYLLIETSTLPGYTIPDDLVSGRKITISQETSKEAAQPLDVINETSKVFLTKTGPDGTLLAGAEFRLEQNFNGVWQPASANSTFVTNAQGILEIEELLPGEYRLIETKAPTGYLLDATPIEFSVSKNAENQIPEVDLDMTNYQGSAKLLKESADGQVLANAQFNVVDSSGKVVNAAPLVSDSSGVVTIKNLAPGNYKFVEVKAPSGYILNQQEYPFTIDSEAVGEPAIVDAGTAVNYQGSAALVKTNKDGTGLSGASFDVYDSNDVKINQAPLTSGADGTVKIDKLAPGTYYFKEAAAPDGYILNTQTYSFTIPESNNGELPLVTVGEAINYKGSAELTKVNGQGELLAGAKFSVYDENNQLIQAGITSDEDGKVRIDELAPGRYYFKETKAPVDKNGQDYVINDYPVFFTVPESADGEPEVLNLGEFQNFKGKISLTKEGEAAQTIAGAEFTIYRANDQNEEIVERVVTVDEAGQIDISNLRPGSYKIVETKAPIGYIINTQPIYFVINSDSETEPVVDPVTVPNYQISIVAYKLDGDSNAPDRGLAGAEFVVLNEDGSPLDETQQIYDANGNEITESNKLTSDENGRVYASGTAAGTFQLVETKAPDGYILDTTPIFFTVENQAGKPESIEIPLGDINNYKGKFAIKKVNEDGKLLTGGIFHIENQAGEKQTVTDIMGNSVTELSANEKGLIAGGGLAPGTYTLVEDEAPDGYMINTEPLSFTISKEITGKPTTENGGLFNGQFVNYTGKAQLLKVDDNNQTLSGAEFMLYDNTGKEMKSYVSDAEGKVVLNNLTPGSYELKEINAPSGYQLSDKVVSFTVSNEAAGKPTQIDLGSYVNDKIPETPKTPKTPTRKPGGRLANLNSLVNNLWVYAGIVVVLVASGILIKRQRKTEK
ncbi:SpaA isopeptide-forming pilin-related protein [uncultured Enterococcus sp.]|uniref:SpaA isopeptide-forming pilin-related protein n=1 Tax=uncultured Enterococcus sp. TaxID=167972 RepID=UPI002AA954ED|nr:SpaA isopeptide-forming pilin-related protein [uncultured Enterococcus sp.]